MARVAIEQSELNGTQAFTRDLSFKEIVTKRANSLSALPSLCRNGDA